MVSLTMAYMYQGHINHSLFWKNLAPKSSGGGELPQGELLSAIESEWGSFDAFVSKFNAAAAGVQGKQAETRTNHAAYPRILASSLTD